MNPAQLRTWLLRAPKPTQLRLTCEGEAKLLPVNDTWASLAKTIIALEPELIEALDDKGQLIRVTRTDGDADELDPETPVRVLPGVQHQIAMVDVATMQLVAKLLAEAYKHSTEVAFARLADLFAASAKRSDNLEKSLAAAERLLRKQVEDQLAGAPEAGDGGLLAQMAQSFLAGQAQPTPTNGKGQS